MATVMKNGSVRVVGYINPNKVDEADIAAYVDYKLNTVGVKESMLLRKALRLLMENDQDFGNRSPISKTETVATPEQNTKEPSSKNTVPATEFFGSKNNLIK